MYKNKVTTDLILYNNSFDSVFFLCVEKYPEYLLNYSYEVLVCFKYFIVIIILKIGDKKEK